MKEPGNKNRAACEDSKVIELVNQVEELNEEAKSLALNLAIYLAKRKKNSEKLSIMEPDFIKLVNGTIKVVHEVTHIVNAAKNMEKMLYEIPSGSMEYNQLEHKLRSILKQCQGIMSELLSQDELIKGFDEKIL